MGRVTVARKAWVLLPALSGVLGLVVLDETVVGVALPTIQADLAMDVSGSHWVVNAYLLAFTGCVALGGRMGDMLGLGRLFLTGLALFGLGSLGAGLSGSGAELIGARAVQGIGAAFVFPATFAIMTRAFPPERRGTAFGVQTTIAGLFMASGPLLGGVFAETLSWRWIFFVNLPVVVLIAATTSLAWLPALDKAMPDSPGRRPPFDVPGLVTLLVGLSALTIALMEVNDWGLLATPTLVLLLVGFIAMGLFWRNENRRPAPLVDLALLRIPAFAGGVLVFFAFQFDKIIVFVFVPLYLQQALDYSPVQAGVPLMLAILPTTVSSLFSGRFSNRFGARAVTLCGLAINAMALLGLAWAAQRGSYPGMLVALFAWGVVLPFLSVVPRHALMSAVPVIRQGQASGVNLTVQMMGGTLGLALCTLLLAATGVFWPVFVVTGALVLLMLPVVLFLFERRQAGTSDRD